MRAGTSWGSTPPAEVNFPTPPPHVHTDQDVALRATIQLHVYTNQDLH